VLLIAEMPVEAAVSQACGRHHVGKARLRDSGSPDVVSSGGNDRFARLRGFLVRLSHQPSLLARPNTRALTN
jgi:hypothetical protein